MYKKRTGVKYRADCIDESIVKMTSNQEPWKQAIRMRGVMNPLSMNKIFRWHDVRTMKLSSLKVAACFLCQINAESRRNALNNLQQEREQQTITNLTKHSYYFVFV